MVPVHWWRRHQLQSNQSNGICWNAGFRLRSSSSSLVNTAKHGGQIKSLWERNYGKRGSTFDDAVRWLHGHACQQTDGDMLCRMLMQLTDEMATWLIRCGPEGRRQQRRNRSDGSIAFCYLLSLAGAATTIIFVATNTCLSRQSTPFVATKVCLLWQKFCRVKNMSLLSRQAYFCRDKYVFCRDKNDTCGSSRQW